MLIHPSITPPLTILYNTPGNTGKRGSSLFHLCSQSSDNRLFLEKQSPFLREVSLGKVPLPWPGRDATFLSLYILVVVPNHGPSENTPTQELSYSFPILEAAPLRSLEVVDAIVSFSFPSQRPMLRGPCEQSSISYPDRHLTKIADH
ncbi:hypothetical protein PoB_004615800 [Plakobranchus ocellatus]|uniref:Uncharacterized protein n=1 Tax=Plakobranchus ocellatus TaxID=259542 RepID=A0AAV4BKH3_9GAST|nr:hypothetical protein PoB_004615800 [Plakobranchus ocellatus]